MLKAADHLEKVKRLRVSDKDIAPLQPNYEVRVCTLPNRMTADMEVQAALRSLKEAYARQ